MDNIKSIDESNRLNELALFAGAGGGILGGLLLNWRTACAVELEAYPRQVLVNRQNEGHIEPFPIWDNVCTFDGKPWRGIIDVISGGFPCFKEGTLVLTTEGWRPIEQISVGDTVLTHKGRWRKVTAVMQRDNAPITKVRGFGILDTYTTAEHPYFVSMGKGSEPKFTPVGNVGKGYYSTMVLPNASHHKTQYSEDWWWLVGRYLADGWPIKNTGRISISSNDKKSEELERRLTNLGLKFNKQIHNGYCKYHISKSDFCNEVKQFGTSTRNKHFTKLAYELYGDHAKALYEGFISGGGDYNREYWYSVSPGLCLDIGMLATRIGKSVPRISEIRHTNSKGEPVRSVYKSFVAGKSKSSFYSNGYFHKKIRSVEQTDERARVYNISVDEDESYIANGAIVHNCQDISIAGKGSGLDGERSGLWFEFARIIKEIEPPFVFIENSPMLKTRGLDQVLADLDQAGYDAAWVVLGADNVGAPHRRKRMWVLGVRRDVLDSYVLRRKTELNESRILEEALDETSEGKSCRTNSDVSDTNCTRELQQEGCKQEQRGRIGDVCEETFGECHVSYTEDQGVMRGVRLIQDDAGTQGTWGCDRRREKDYDCRKWWSPEPGLDRMVDGVAHRVDRLAAIGNGQVPTVASVAFRTLLEIITKQ